MKDLFMKSGDYQKFGNSQHTLFNQRRESSSVANKGVRNNLTRSALVSQHLLKNRPLTPQILNQKILGLEGEITAHQQNLPELQATHTQLLMKRSGFQEFIAKLEKKLLHDQFDGKPMDAQEQAKLDKYRLILNELDKQIAANNPDSKLKEMQKELDMLKFELSKQQFTNMSVEKSAEDVLSSWARLTK